MSKGVSSKSAIIRGHAIKALLPEVITVALLKALAETKNRVETQAKTSRLNNSNKESSFNKRKLDKSLEGPLT